MRILSLHSYNCGINSGRVFQHEQHLNDQISGSTHTITTIYGA